MIHPISLVIALLGVALQLLTLYRLWITGSGRRYGYFLAYIAGDFLSTIFTLVLLKAGAFHAPGTYARWYWMQNLLTLILGYGILLEISRHALAPYRGAERFAQFAGLTAFAAIVLFAAGYRWLGGESPGGGMIEFERNLRLVQAIFVACLLAVIFRYGIPLSRNLKGMIAGYGVYIASSLVTLALRAYAGHSFDAIWGVGQPLSFCVALGIWLFALWSYAPIAAPVENRLETDYDRLALGTRAMVQAARSQLAKLAGE